MDKRSWQYVILSLVALAVAVAGFLYYFEYVKERTWIGFEENKNSAQYYMAGEFLQAQGVQVEFEKTVNQIFPLPDTDTAIFLSTATDYLSENQVNELVDWVTAGGQLILYANPYSYYTDDSGFSRHEDYSRYSLLDGLGLTVESCYCDKDDDSEDEPNELETQIEEILDNIAEEKTVTIPIAEQNVSLRVGPRWWVDEANVYYEEERLVPLHEVKAQNYTEGLALASYQLGDGVVTIHFTDSDIFSDNPDSYRLWANVEDDKDMENIAKPMLMEYNNASYLLYLVGNVSLPEKLIWVEMGAYYSLADLIKKHAMMIVVCVILFILAWLWYSLSRFGSILVENKRESLSVTKHIRAVGDFLAQGSGRPRLIEACYKGLDRDIYQKVDSNRLISQAKLVDKIVARTGLPKIMVASVLKREYPDNDKDYLQLIHNILTIRERL